MAFLQVNSDGVADLFIDYSSNLRLDRQHMTAVAQSHEWAFKGMAVYGAADLDQTLGFKKLGRFRPNDTGPATRAGVLLQFSREFFSQFFSHNWILAQHFCRICAELKIKNFQAVCFKIWKEIH